MFDFCFLFYSSKCVYVAGVGLWSSIYSVLCVCCNGPQRCVRFLLLSSTLKSFRFVRFDFKVVLLEVFIVWERLPA